MRRNVRWMAWMMVAGSLCAQAEDTWQHVTKPLLASEEIQLVKAGSEKGLLWIGMPKGLAKVAGGILQPIPETKGMAIWDVTPRPEGGIWVGHSGGALLLDGTRTVATQKGVIVSKMLLVGSNIWCIANYRLMEAHGEEWTAIKLPTTKPVTDLLLDAKGTVWITIEGDGVLEVDPKKGVAEIRSHLSRMNVTSVLTDSKGRTWCGLMAGGLMMRQNNEWKSFLEKENKSVQAMVEDKDGRLWVATKGSGLWTYDGTAWKNSLKEEGNIELLTITSDKRVWVSTPKGGLQYWTGTEWKESLRNPMPMNSLVELAGGVLVAGSSRDGMFVLGDYSIKGEANDGKSKD